MTQEEKQLLLKDLLGRVLYGVKVDYHTNIFTLGYNLYLNNSDVAFENYPMLYFLENIEKVKPYLRPMESMTEEEKGELEQLSEEYFGKALDKQIQESLSSSNRNESSILEYIASSVIVDWLNKKMFDYRRLIPMGLALTATEDMYN